MSLGARRFRRAGSAVVCACGRPARFRRPSDGRRAADSAHDLCAACYRAELDRARLK